MFTPKICKHWFEVHWYGCGWYLDCPTLKCHLLALEGNEDVFDSISKPLITQSPLDSNKDIKFEGLYGSPIIKS